MPEQYWNRESECQKVADAFTSQYKIEISSPEEIVFTTLDFGRGMHKTRCVLIPAVSNSESHVLVGPSGMYLDGSEVVGLFVKQKTRCDGRMFYVYYPDTESHKKIPDLAFIDYGYDSMAEGESVRVVAHIVLFSKGEDRDVMLNNHTVGGNLYMRTVHKEGFARLGKNPQLRNTYNQLTGVNL